MIFTICKQVVISRYRDATEKCKVTIYLDEMVCRAVITISGVSTDKKTAMTTISIMVVLLASRCLLLSRLPLDKQCWNKWMVLTSWYYRDMSPDCSCDFTLLAINFCLLLSAFLMAENKRMLRMTRETQGTRWTQTTRNLIRKYLLTFHFHCFKNLCVEIQIIILNSWRDKRIGCVEMKIMVDLHLVKYPYFIIRKKEEG